MILALFRERVDDEHALGAVIDKGYSGDSAATAEEKAALCSAALPGLNTVAYLRQRRWWPWLGLS